VNINFSAWSIHRPIPSILLFFLLTIAGILAFVRLEVAVMPDIEFPGVLVGVALPGATPSQLETEVTRKIEDATANIAGVRHVQSTLTDGSSSTFIEFELEKDVQEALDDVRDAVTGVRSSLPPDVLEPTVRRVTVNDNSIATYVVRSDSMDDADLSWFVDNVVAKAIMPIRGVGRVTRFGGITREVRIELDPTRLLAYGVTAGEVSHQIGAAQQEAPGGRGNLGGLEQAVRTIGTLNSAESLSALYIPLADGRRVRLDQVGTVRDTPAESRQAALLDGKRVISFRIFRAQHSAEAAVARAVQEEIEVLRQKHPQVQIDEVYNNVGPIETSFKGTMNTLLEGAFLAVVVVWVFLREWRATLVSAVALPLSILPTFAFIYWAGYSLNMITLLALTLVIGILVDDAIVEVENIIRHQQMGKRPMQASLEAADEIGLAVIATSLTLVSVFLPVAMMPGVSGLFFRQFGWTTSIAVIASLVVARLVTPMMAAYLLKDRPPPEHGDGPIMRRYLSAVQTCLRNPWKTVAGSAVFFIASASLVVLIPTSFLDAGDGGVTVVTVEGPPGSTLAQTLETVQAAEARMQGIPEVRHLYTLIGNGVTAGSSGAESGDVTTAAMVLPLTPVEDRDRLQQEIDAELRERLADLPGVRVTVGNRGNGEELRLQLTSEDAAMLATTAEQVLREARSIPGIGGATSSASLLRPELVIRPDFARAAELGVTAQAIGAAIRVATTGDYDVSLPKLNLPERQLFIRTMLKPEARGDLETLRLLRVTASTGASVPLGNVADISIQGGPAQIERYDRARTVTLVIRLAGRPLGEISKAVQALPSMRNLPPQVRPVEAGEAEFQRELFSGFFAAMLTGIFCVYAVMVLLFHDFAQPVTVLAALPLAAGGALGSLVLLGLNMSMAALIGLLMLIGIVSKNSILLVEYAVVARRERGLSRFDAIVDACHKRARPIVMTTVAMIAGMLPMALNLDGGDASFSRPMSVTVIGGLLTSTVLSLVVVPVVYELIDDITARIKRRLGLRHEIAHAGDPGAEIQPERGAHG